ncbi:GNAT family N-acetyltransferase [Hathewaya histolytica]|uniref:GNAT family N-acetyltransferase n=1 Tax=Hathewaya histolytica TaxID=1498 RepID=UPI003B67059D
MDILKQNSTCKFKEDNNIHTEEISVEGAPMELLLLADPSEDAINKYIRDCKILVTKLKSKVIGVIAFVEKRSNTYEIMNLAVDEGYRGRGIGKKLIYSAEYKIKKLGGEKILIGTGNSSINQLLLYQKVGFRMVEIRRDFFIVNYVEKIYENGIRCMDMVRLEKKI